MHAQRAAAALGQNLKIAARLGGLDHAEAGPLAGHGEILCVIGCDLKKYPAVRPALVGLPGRMQEPWSEFGTGGDMTVVTNLQPHPLQSLDMGGVPFNIGEQREVVVGISAREMGFKPG